MKNVFYFFVCLAVAALSVFTGSCKNKKNTTVSTTTQAARDFEKEGYVKANVIYSDLASCPYLLVLANEKRLEPSAQLAADFQKDQLAVWIKYTEKKGGVSVCMAGQLVEVSDIQQR